MANALPEPTATEPRRPASAAGASSAAFDPSAAIGFALGSVFFSLYSGKIALWSNQGPTLSPSMTLAAAASLACLAVGLLLAWRQRRFETGEFALGATATLGLFFFSDWMNRSYSLLVGPSIRGEIVLGALIGAFLLSRGSVRLVGYLALPFTLAVLLYSFAREVSGRLLLGDDHSVFLHRLSLLKENFPAIPVYDTSWNGGLDSLHLFATGVLNVFALFFPLLYLGPVEDVYTAIVGLILFGLVPICSYVGARLMRCSPSIACLSAVLSVTQGLFFYRWGLVYGTLGFITSCALLPLVFALFCRFLQRPAAFTIGHAVLLFFSCSLLLLWPLAGVPFVIIAATLLVRIRVVLRSPRFLIACLSVVLVTLPWVYVLWTGWNVKTFIAADIPATHEAKETAPKFKGNVFRINEREVSIREAITIIRDNASPTNPLILVCSLPGMLLLGSLTARIFLGTALWLVLAACIGGPLKPQLELERMLLMLSVLCAIPAAVTLQYVLQQFASPRLPRRALALLAFGFLFAAIASTAAVVGNRRLEQFHLAQPSFYRLATLLEQHSGDGRALFSGFVLHELNQGHLAPLSHFIGTPMIASSPVHNVWRYKDVIPPAFLAKGPQGVESYFDLWNVSLVAAHEPNWRAFFRAQPAQYTEVGDEASFVLFRRHSYPRSYFYEGAGTVIEQDTSHIRLRLSTRDAVLRFRYNRFLKAEGCSAIEGKKIAEEVEFIALKNCSLERDIRISSQLFFERKLGGMAQLGQQLLGSRAR